MCFFVVTGGMVTVIIVFYHDNIGLHGNYRSFTAVKKTRGDPRVKPCKKYRVLPWGLSTTVSCTRMADYHPKNAVHYRGG